MCRGTLGFSPSERLPSPLSPCHSPPSPVAAHSGSLSLAPSALSAIFVSGLTSSLPRVSKAPNRLRFILEPYDRSSDTWTLYDLLSYLSSNLNLIITNILSTWHPLLHLIPKMNLWGRYLFFEWGNWGLGKWVIGVRWQFVSGTPGLYPQVCLMLSLRRWQSPSVPRASALPHAVGSPDPSAQLAESWTSASQYKDGPRLLIRFWWPACRIGLHGALCWSLRFAARYRASRLFLLI